MFGIDFGYISAILIFMSPEELDLLFKTHEIVQENNKILRSLRSSQRWDRIIKYGYWFIIIALSFGAYYFIQPYAESLGIRSPQGDTQKVSDLQELLKGI